VDYAKEMARILNREFALCSELLYVARAQRSVITSGDVAALAELVSRAEEIIGAIRDEEIGLADLAKRWADETEVEVEDAEQALAVMIALFKEEEMAEFEVLRDSIAGILAEIDSANAINAMLIQDAIEYIENTVRLIAEADGTNSVYSRLGRMDKKAVSSAVDDTA